MTNYRLGPAESLQRITIPLVRLLFYHASLFLVSADFVVAQAENPAPPITAAVKTATFKSDFFMCTSEKSQ